MLGDDLYKKIYCDFPNCNREDAALIDYYLWDSNDESSAELEVTVDKLPEGWIEFEKTEKAYGVSYNLKCHFCPEHSGADKE